MGLTLIEHLGLVLFYFKTAVLKLFGLRIPEELLYVEGMIWKYFAVETPWSYPRRPQFETALNQEKNQDFNFSGFLLEIIEGYTLML